MKYKFKILICTWVSLGFATETGLVKKVQPTEFANLHAVKSEIYSNLGWNDLRQVVEVDIANKAAVIDLLKPRLQKAIQSKELICEFSWKELQEIAKLEGLKPLVDEFCESRMGLIQIQATKDEEGYLQFEPSLDSEVLIEFLGHVIKTPDLNKEAIQMPCKITFILKILDGYSRYNLTFSNHIQSFVGERTYPNIKVDKNLLKKLCQIWAWLKQEFDLDNSEGGAKKLFTESKRLKRLSWTMNSDLEEKAWLEVIFNSNELKEKAKQKMGEYLRPMLMGLGIDMKYFNLDA